MDIEPSKIVIPVEYIRELQHEAGKIAYKSTCHFIKVENGIYEAHGSGVFIEIDKNFFYLRQPMFLKVI